MHAHSAPEECGGRMGGVLAVDTIVAVATPAGQGGVALLRISGAEAYAVAMRVVSVRRLAPRHATYCQFLSLSAEEGNEEAQRVYIDDGVATFFPAPHSYTGEDTVELSCHGSPYVQQALMRTVMAAGACMAEAGEFTRRAFMHGRLNLSQAEAVADLIEATTPMQHRLAVSQLRGGYARHLSALRARLLDLASLFELELDFTEEDVEFANRGELSALLAELEGSVSTLLSSFAAGNALKLGVPVAIVGEPNVGKSTLLNALVGDDRAIVSATPGTTRDTVEELLTVGEITFRMIDTAGLRASDDEVERMGMARSLQAVRSAAVVMLMGESRESVKAVEDILSAEVLQGKHVLRVLTKEDMSAHPQYGALGQTNGWFRISALMEMGLDELKEEMVQAVEHTAQGDVLLTNERHREALQRVEEALHRTATGLREGFPTDLVAIDMRDALFYLGSITGEVTTNELLDNIFGRFCVGK
ncbi:MAG: tRNA uridine-5-carboxymethylaminomethyl(34) synthesis GTPase MnmE [Bacteroidales bacterium]|nr:tRNA uridine-5-carboxymethylaminomethyl(34) synthesis GTPase MnmE [Bacteroidales bacterium]